MILQNPFDNIPEWDGEPHEPDIPIKDYANLSRQDQARYRLLSQEEDMQIKAKSAERRAEIHRHNLRNLRIKQAAVVVLASCVLVTGAVKVTGNIQEANAQRATLEQLSELSLSDRMPENMPAELKAFIEENSTLTHGEFSAMFNQYVADCINHDAESFYHLAHALEVTPSDNTQAIADDYRGFMNQNGYVSKPFMIAYETLNELYRNTTSDEHMLQVLRAEFFQAIVDDYNLVGVTEADFNKNDMLLEPRGFLPGNSSQITIADFNFAMANQLTDEKTYETVQQMELDAATKMPSIQITR